MKIIYDKEKAILTKTQIDEETEKMIDGPRVLGKRFYWFLAFLCGVSLFFIIWGMIELSEFLCVRQIPLLVKVFGLFGCCIVTLISVVVIGNLISQCRERGTLRGCPEKRYPLAVKYHLLTTQPDKAVMKTDAYLCESNLTHRQTLIIQVDLEDAHHVVTRETIRFPSEKSIAFPVQHRTDIDTTAFDLDIETLLEPYHRPT